MKESRLDNELEGLEMNNPGIDRAVWERLRQRWAELQSDGRKLRIDFRLIADPADAENILAIDVIQKIDDEIITETVQRTAGEAYATLGIAGLSREGLVEVYKEMLHQLHSQTKRRDADLIVTMSPSSPTAGEIRGYMANGDSNLKSSVFVNYQHYYMLNALREKMIEVGEGWGKVKAVYRSGELEFFFEHE